MLQTRSYCIEDIVGYSRQKLDFSGVKLAIDRADWATTEGTNPAKGFANLPSFISRIPAKPLPGSTVLVLDIGGTNFRAALRIVENDGREHWQPLLNCKNSELKEDTTENSYRTFATKVAGKLKQQLDENTIDASAISGLSVTWSNAADVYLDTGCVVKGVYAKVSNRTTSYSKGEWFIRDLRDGDDLAAPMIEAFYNQGVTNLECVKFSNDTIDIATFGSGGVIASSGANSTSVRIVNGVEQLCNDETGNFIKIPENLAFDFELLALGSLQPTIEQLTTGKTLGNLFLAHLIHAEQKMENDSNRNGKDLREMSELITEIVAQRNSEGNVPCEILSKWANERYTSRSSFTEMVAMRSAEFLEKRAGHLMAYFVYGAALTQLNDARDEGKKINIAIESSIAKYFPRIKLHMINELDALEINPYICLNFIRLPSQLSDKISPTMAGAAMGLDRVRDMIATAA